MGAPARRWLFADQLGPAYTDRPRQPVLLIESRAALARRRYHRQKLHLLLSALRHAAADRGRRAVLVRAPSYARALDDLGEPVSVCEPTSRAALAFVRRRPEVTVVPGPGFATHRDEFAGWAGERHGRLRLEDFYRWARRRHGVLMDGDDPAGGVWNTDRDNREPPPRQPALDVPGPWRPAEDDIDAGVREDLDRWTRDGVIDPVGADGPRWFPASRAEAVAALDHFVTHRLATFGRWEDAMLAADPTMSHSMLSPALNLGLLHPLEVVAAAESAYRAGRVPLNSAEGFVRQVLGWREYVWGLYWYLGPAYRRRNVLRARRRVPGWLADLDADGQVRARCLSTVLAEVRDHGWTHHIPRLMVLGNWAAQHGIDPAALSDWFQRSFVDGYEWVMLPNVVGMSQWADGGQIVTKPYLAGGGYINRMSDFCGACRYRPGVRVGERACPFTAGYWAALARDEERLAGNHRMRPALATLHRLSDLDAVLDAERRRGTSPP